MESRPALRASSRPGVLASLRAGQPLEAWSHCRGHIRDVPMIMHCASSHLRSVHTMQQTQSPRTTSSNSPRAPAHETPICASVDGSPVGSARRPAPQDPATSLDGRISSARCNGRGGQHAGGSGSRQCDDSSRARFRLLAPYFPCGTDIERGGGVIRVPPGSGVASLSA
jgi:hypothetical protein